MNSVSPALSKSPLIIFSCRSDGTITLSQGGGLKLHGLSENEHLGYNALEIYKSLPGFIEALKIALGGKPCQAVYKWGSDFCETHMVPIENGGVVAVCTSQTARILRDEERLDKRVILAKEETKLEYLNIIAHELRSPIAGIICLLNIIKDDNTNEYIDLISQTANQLLSLVNDLLDYSKLSSGKFQVQNTPFNIESVIHNSMSLFKPEAMKKDINFTSDIICGNQNILGDPNRINQMLRNYLSNALKFTPTKGSVNILLEIIDNSLLFTIKDTGPGIAKDDLDKLFKDYIQLDTKEMSKGTGLGLSINKKLAEALGGDTGCKSEIGIGSSFWFTIPYIPMDIPLVFNAFEDIHIKTHSSRILVAEDDPTMRLVIRKILSKLGFVNVTIVENGQKALFLIQNKNIYDYVLLDNKMPKMNGETTAKFIREFYTEKKHLHSPYLVWMSAEPISEALLYTLQFDKMIQKPFNEKEIKKILVEV